MDADWFAEGPDQDWFKVSEHLGQISERCQWIKDNGYNMHEETAKEAFEDIEFHTDWLHQLLSGLRRHHHAGPNNG